MNEQMNLRVQRINKLYGEDSRRWAERTVARWNGATFGVEAVAYPSQDECLPGGSGVWVEYVNAGDSYDLTLYRIEPDPDWKIGCFADALEEAQEAHAEGEMDAL